MTLRQIKRALRRGIWTLAPRDPVTAATEFQRKRLTRAVTAARVYLGGPVKLEEMGKTLGITGEGAAQIVRLGVNYMMQTGVLRPAAGPSENNAP